MKFRNKRGFTLTEVAIAVAIIAILIAIIVSAISNIINNGDSDANIEGLEEGVIYIQNLSVNYTTESESPNGSIDENSMGTSKTAARQQCYIVMDFGLQMATDNSNGETITVQLTISNAYSVSSRINYAETSTTSLSTKNNITTITATYTLPSKAGDITNKRLVISVSPDAVGEADVSYEFACKTKVPCVSSVIDGYISVTQEEISLKSINYIEYSLDSELSAYEVTSLTSSSYTDIEIKSQINGIPVTTIADNAFYGKTSVTSITLPGSITSIGGYAFYKCTALTSIELSTNITSIGEYAFSGCSALTGVTIPNKVTSLGKYAFESCTSLKNVSLGSGLTSIGEYAFSGCSALTSITIPYYVDTIGKYVFEKCTSLTSVTFENAVGWYQTFVVKMDIDVTDASTNAKNMTSTWSSYIGYTWHRSSD